MIFVDFAPNESFGDCVESLRVLLRPQLWFVGSGKKHMQATLEGLVRQLHSGMQVKLFFNGRAALKNLIVNLNLSKGAQIIVQGFTCEAVVVPIIAAGAEPIYCDIEPQTYSINPDNLSKLLTNKTRAIIIQHTFGLVPVGRDKIIEFAKKNNLTIIEDLAHSTLNNDLFKYLSECKSDYSNHYFLFSFGRSKGVSSIFGGAIAGANLDFFDEACCPCRQISKMFLFKLLIYKPIVVIIKVFYNLNYYLGLAFHKAVNISNLLVPEISSKEKAGYYDNSYDVDYPNALAVLFLVQYRRLSKKIELKIQSAWRYLSLLSKSQSDYFSKILRQNIVMLRFPLRLKSRSHVVHKLRSIGVMPGSWYNQVVAPLGLPLDKVNYKVGSCPVAEDICREIINLPLDLPQDKIGEIIKTVEQYV